MEIKVLKAVLEENENKANQIRETLKKKNITMLNLISSPGSGKTTLLDSTIAQLKTNHKIAVIEGDVATDRDAQRLKAHDIPIVLINTDGGCHLNSLAIENALGELDLDNLDIIFIENVGNLVCPAEFDLGENAKIALISTTEGDDKPIKYPFLFREAQIAILNKIDLISYTNFSKDSFYNDIKKINASLPVIETSCTNNTGLEEWFSWIKKQVMIPAMK